MSPESTQSSSLLQCLIQEIHAMAEPSAERCSAGPDAEHRLRVPLELGGAVWAAEVEDVHERGVQLIVDRQAVDRPLDTLPAVIRYQPENMEMRRTEGSVCTGGFLPHNRIRLNFTLR